MSLVKCGECGKEISSDAMKCPNCGAITRESSKIGCLILGVIFIVGFILWKFMFG